MKICLFTASDNLLKSINIHSEIILKSIQEVGSFTIINFNNILKKKQQNLIDDQSNTFILKNKFGEKINYINPSKKSDFLEYIGNDKIFAIDGLGKTFIFFSIRKLINKKNIKLILIMNLGFVSNELSYSISSFKGYLFKFKKKINNLIYKFLVIINFFPNIYIYFESRKKIYQNCIKNKKKKLSFLFPFLNILYFENVYKINALSHEHYLKNKNKLEEKKIIFLDGNYKHQDIIGRENINIIELKKNYFQRVDIFFKWIENIFDQKVEICLHPSSNKKEYEDFFINNTVTQNKTYESLVKASIVIFHESSSILDAIIYKKKIISLSTNLFGRYMSNRIIYYKKILNLYSIDLDNYDNYKNYNKKDIESKLKYSIKNYDTYIGNYIKSDNEELGSDKIIKVLKKYE
jgi:hypothetical protein